MAKADSSFVEHFPTVDMDLCYYALFISFRMRISLPRDIERLVSADRSFHAATVNMADPLDELSSLLFSLLATTNFDKHARRFWPEGCLDSMMTKQGTQELISEALGIQLNDPIIKFIIGSAKKLLAIVVILEFRKPLTAMKLFKEKSFSDSDLPLMDSDFERLKDSSHGSTFWSDSRKSSFSDKQWEFVVPVIDLDNPSHKWSFSHILPFVKKEEAASGSFGKVSRCEIHKAHLTSAQNTVSTNILQLWR